MARTNHPKKEPNEVPVYGLPVSGHFHIWEGQFLSGYKLAERNHYPRELLDQAPRLLVNNFLGIGNPFLLGALPQGGTIVDVYSSGGLDAYLASRMVGPTGKVYGIEVCTGMFQQAIETTKSTLARNLTFLHAWPDQISLPDGMADSVISNGGINLQVSPASALTEIYRILKPGGSIQIADAVTTTKADLSLDKLFKLWSTIEDIFPELLNYHEILREAGFREIEFSRFWPILIQGKGLNGVRLVGSLCGHIHAVKSAMPVTGNQQ